jgi:hypothetical protein
MEAVFTPQSVEIADILFAPSNDLSLIAQLWDAGGQSREEALKLADADCRRHRERNTPKEKSHVA